MNLRNGWKVGKYMVKHEAYAMEKLGRYILVEPRNPEAIAEGVEDVYKGEVKDNGKRVFSWDECVEGYLEVYQEVFK